MSTGQLYPLVRLRWAMVRSRPRRTAIVVGLAAFLGALALALLATGRVVKAGLDLEVDLPTQALIVYPAALLLFAVVAIIAPFLAGGAIEIFPPSHLVAYPITPWTRFKASLVLMPFNITWLLQVVLLAFLVAVGGGGEDRTWRLAAVTLAFVVTATIAGQAFAWAGTAVRQTRIGRVSTNALAAVLLVMAALNFNQDALFRVADQSPLLPLLGSALAPLGPRFYLTLLLLMVVAAAAYLVGVRAVGWTLRLGIETAGTREGARQRIHRNPAHPGSAVRRALWLSVWRSKPIRRGVLLLVTMPIAVAAMADLDWSEIVALPGLVAAGAALLFGVNGLSLLGGGAAWIGSQPLPPTLMLRELGLVIGGVITSATTVTTLGVSLFAPGLPTRAEVVALVVGAVTSTVWISVSALRLSVRAPYQADLRGNRDAPAPPGAMAGYSIRLAGTVGVLGLALVAAAQIGRPTVAIVLGLLVLVAAGLRFSLVRARWRDPAVRARAFLSVAFG